MVIREQIIEEANSWLRTPYHPSARVKGVGTDCAQLLYCVFNKFGFIPEMPAEARSSRWFVANKDQSYLKTILNLAREIPESQADAGDIVLYKQPMYEIFHHAAIVVRWPDAIIHAIRGVGVSMAHGTNEGFITNAERKVFTFMPQT